MERGLYEATGPLGACAVNNDHCPDQKMASFILGLHFYGDEQATLVNATYTHLRDGGIRPLYASLWTGEYSAKTEPLLFRRCADRLHGQSILSNVYDICLQLKGKGT